MPDTPTNLTAPTPIVAVVSWLIPGGGYWLIGQRSRALAIGMTIVAMYLAGILIGGIRVVDVPGYGDNGQRIQVRTTGGPTWIMYDSPMQEIRAKPWAIAQVLTGPIGIVSGAISVWSSEPDSSGHQLAHISKAAVNEDGTLYTAVAGMLNLLAIIDAAHRTTQQETL